MHFPSSLLFYFIGTGTLLIYFVFLYFLLQLRPKNCLRRGGEKLLLGVKIILKKKKIRSKVHKKLMKNDAKINKNNDLLLNCSRITCKKMVHYSLALIVTLTAGRSDANLNTVSQTLS